MDKRLIHTLFERNAILKEDHIAVQTETHARTYRELNAEANRLASLLSIRGMKKGDVAAAFPEDPLVQIISLLAIFKAGAIYLPLDKKYQQNHWQELYENIQPKVIIISNDNLELLYKYNALFEYSIPEIIVASIDAQGKLSFSVLEYSLGVYTTLESGFTLSADNPVVEMEGEDSNYIFFTSGSAGKPKAVLGKHISLSHFIHWVTGEFPVIEADRIGLLASFSFDASLHDIFAAFITGATLFIPARETKEDVLRLQHWISKHQISVLHIVPTLFRLLALGVHSNQLSDAPDFSHLKYIFLAGEKLYKKDVVNWRHRYGLHTTLINLYGTTETTNLSTFYIIEDVLPESSSEVFCVGKPISNTAILILNTNNELCRINEEGSIYIKTPFTTKGYYNNPEQTAQKFVQNPLNAKEDIIYRTGDYGKYDPNRNVVVLGREDEVVKLNGVRIDINYIERTLLSLDKVQAVKCLLYRQEDDIDSTLCCFYTSAAPMDDLIRKHCMQFLSGYEIPSFFTHLEKFPINANGKIDADNLRGSIQKRLTEVKGNAAPQNEIEEKLAELWGAVLGAKNIGAEDSFLALGGTSIKQILLISKIRSAFGFNVTFEDLFTHPTIRAQGNLISSVANAQLKREEDRIVPVLQPGKIYSVSNEQLRIWATSQSDAESAAHNMSYTYDVYGDFDMELFRKVLYDIVSRHEALRTSFSTNSKGEVIQIISDEVKTDTAFEFVLGGKYLTEAEIKYTLKSFSQFVFDLSSAPLFRVLLIRLSENEYILSTLMHHIIGDQTSNQIIINEVMRLYDAYRHSRPLELNEIKVHYKDYTQWIRNKAKNNKFKSEQNFWKTHLENVFQQPKWYEYFGAVDYTGAYYSKTFNDNLVSEIRNYCARSNRSLMTVIVSALGILVHKINGQQDVIIGAPVNLRNHPDLIGQVGLYLNLLPVRVRVNPQGHVEDIVKETSKNQVKWMDYSFYPFDAIIDEFEKRSGFNLIDRIDLYLNFVNYDEESEKIGGVEFAYRDRESKTSKFPICFYVTNYKTKISIRIEYQISIFKPREIEKLYERFCMCIGHILKDPDKQISSISLVDKEKIPTFRLG